MNLRSPASIKTYTSRPMISCSIGELEVRAPGSLPLRTATDIANKRQESGPLSKRGHTATDPRTEEPKIGDTTELLDLQALEPKVEVSNLPSCDGRVQGEGDTLCEELEDSDTKQIDIVSMSRAILFSQFCRKKRLNPVNLGVFSRSLFQMYHSNIFVGLCLHHAQNFFICTKISFESKRSIVIYNLTFIGPPLLFIFSRKGTNHDRNVGCRIGEASHPGPVFGALSRPLPKLWGLSSYLYRPEPQLGPIPTFDHRPPRYQLVQNPFEYQINLIKRLLRLPLPISNTLSCILAFFGWFLDGIKHSTNGFDHDWKNACRIGEASHPGPAVTLTYVIKRISRVGGSALGLAGTALHHLSPTTYWFMMTGGFFFTCLSAWVMFAPLSVALSLGLNRYKLKYLRFMRRAFSETTAVTSFVALVSPGRVNMHYMMRGLVAAKAFWLKVQPRSFEIGAPRVTVVRTNVPINQQDYDAVNEFPGLIMDINQLARIPVPDMDNLVLPTRPRPRVPISLNYNPIVAQSLQDKLESGPRNMLHPNVVSEVDWIGVHNARPAWHPSPALLATRAAAALMAAPGPGAAAAAAPAAAAGAAVPAPAAPALAPAGPVAKAEVDPMGRLIGKVTTSRKEYWTPFVADSSESVLSTYSNLPDHYKAVVDDALATFAGDTPGFQGFIIKKIRHKLLEVAAKVNELVPVDPTYRFQIDKVNAPNVHFLIHYRWESRPNSDSDIRADARAVGWRNCPIDADPYLLLVERHIEVVTSNEMKRCYTRAELNCVGRIDLPPMLASLSAALNVGFHARGSSCDKMEEHMLRVMCLQTINLPVDGDWIIGTKELVFAIGHNNGVSGTYTSAKNFDVVSNYSPQRPPVQSKL